MRHIGPAYPTLLLAAALTLVSGTTHAATVEVTTADDYTKIESAKAGDEVLIHPGTYRFRVHITAKGTATSPIVIRAKDPSNPPVWDLSAGYVEDAKGSYTAGDRGRGCWQLSGATNVQISNLVISGCHNATHNSAGLRYYAAAAGIRLEHVYFHDNDNGLTGGTQSSEMTAEFCEFAQNGNALASAPTHNIYIYGGTFALRYSYLHDPVQGQNFHVRAKVSVIEYNWFSRAKSYAGDLMTDDDNDGSLASTQTMLLRGNVIVQGNTQTNSSQIVAVYNDTGVANLTLQVRLSYNTFVGSGGHAALVHLANADGTSMSAELSNNVIYGTSRPTLIDDQLHATVAGANNWLLTGADAAGLTGSVFGADPSFKNAAKNDFSLAAGSSAIGAALGSVTGLPTAEYYRDEALTCSYRARTQAKDIGAFESTTAGNVIGPGGNVGQAGAAGSGNSVGTGAHAGTGASASAGTGNQGPLTSGGHATALSGGSTSAGAGAAIHTGLTSSAAGSTISGSASAVVGGSSSPSSSMAVSGSVGSNFAASGANNGSESNGASGCGCNVPSTTQTPGAFVVLGLLGLARKGQRRGRVGRKCRS
ncbi:MAG TPA: hypothetical protein VIV60_27855 [Polyangiaceae bacterium]